MAKWYNDSGFQSDIVLSTRVRLARNIKGIPFPNKMTNDDAKKIIDMTDSALEGMNFKFNRIDVNELSPGEKEELVEKHYISPKLARQTKPCAVFVSEDESVSIMVNEEDHIRLQSIYAGLECQKAYDIISKIDAFMAEKLDYAVHTKYGYLTSCLTNVGTGMRISFMVHLPAVCRSSVADNLFAALGKIGVAVRGMYGEGTKASGYIFQISNQKTLGTDEKEIADKLYDVANQVISKERELRTILSKQQGIALEDKIMRSLGIIKNARLLSGKEMLALFSDIRFGISLGFVKDTDTKTLNRLMIETSPAHLVSVAQNAGERDIHRARIVRESFSKEE